MADKTNREIITIIKRFISLLESNGIHIDYTYLFGSYARGIADEWSDIDIAVVSDDFKGSRMIDKQRLLPFVLKIDNRLEVHPYKTSEFNENERWFIKEIIDTGMKIV